MLLGHVTDTHAQHAGFIASCCRNERRAVRDGPNTGATLADQHVHGIDAYMHNTRQKKARALCTFDTATFPAQALVIVYPCRRPGRPAMPSQKLTDKQNLEGLCFPRPRTLCAAIHTTNVTPDSPKHKAYRANTSWMQETATGTPSHNH